MQIHFLLDSPPVIVCRKSCKRNWGCESIGCSVCSLCMILYCFQAQRGEMFMAPLTRLFLSFRALIFNPLITSPSDVANSSEHKSQPRSLSCVTSFKNHKRKAGFLSGHFPQSHIDILSSSENSDSSRRSAWASWQAAFFYLQRGSS